MKKRNYLLFLIAFLCICILGAAICAGYLIWNQTIEKDKQRILDELRDQLKTSVTVIVTETIPEDTTLSEPDSHETAEQMPDDWLNPPATETESLELETVTLDTAPLVTEPPETEPPKSQPNKVVDALLDFPYMWKTNPDICAWIEIDGTLVNYPILQSPTNDNKYLNTAIDGSYYIGGSLFTQATYNNKDFNDPVTIIYGHTMRSGALFGQLQSTYSSSSGFSDHSEIKLYLPNEVRYYTVFAAVPYTNIHILDAYDFSKPYWYENFFDGVMDIRAFGAQFNKDIVPEPGDRVMILSTCLNEDSTQRFLVMAIYQDDIS